MAVRRVVYVLKIFPKISETFIATELTELRRRGIQVRVLSLLPPREKIQHDIVSSAGLGQIVCYDPAQFQRVVAEFRPDLLHAHFATESTAVARELAGQFRLPFTFTCHGYDIYRKPPHDFAARAKTACAVVTVSNANASYVTRTFGVPAKHLRVIPCGVDTTRFRPQGALKQSPPLILAVARLVPVKNLGLLLHACHVLRRRGLIFRCLIIGEGPCRPELEALRMQLDLSGCLEMPGAAEQREIAQLWQRASVGVLSSLSEGMPVSLMEAAACGVPVVATAVGGVPELVRDGVTGLLTPSGNPEAMASALERVLRNPALAIRMGRAARERAEGQFSVDCQIDQLVTLWSEAVDLPPSSGANMPVPPAHEPALRRLSKGSGSGL